MASFDVMRLTPSQVTKRTRSLEQIAENLERYVQGLERGTVHWDIIVHLAQHMMVVNPKHQHDYDFRQNAPVMGSIGRQLRGRQFVDKLLYPAWVVQIGAAAARQNYNSECLLHRNLDPAVIDEIAVAELAGDQAIKKYKDQLPLPICDQDEAFMVMYENRRRGAHHSIVKAMKKDHMLVNDPYEVWKYVFRVRVATFFNTPSFMVGMNIRENHIMDQHLVSERLRALQHMADKQGSWLKSHIAAARASLLKMETFDDVHVLSMFLGSNSKITPTTESVILVSVAMWMHTPNDTRGECSVHFEAYRELVHILDEDSKTNPQVYDMWKSPSVHRPYPLLLAYLNEDDQGPQGLMALCKTNAGVEKHGRKQLAEDTACRKQIIEVKARQVKAEMKESYHQMPTSAEGRVRDGETGANERILHEAQGTKIHHDQKSKDAENRLVQDAHKLAHRGVQLFVKPEKSAQSPIPEQQKTTPSKQKLEEKSKQILIEILDEINSDGQFGDDSRWFCRLMKAVANPDQLFDHEKFDYLDTPDMLKGMKTHRLARLTRCVQRRKEFGGILVKLVAGRITSQMELGDMAVYFRRARIAVSKRRQNIPYGRMGRDRSYPGRSGFGVRPSIFLGRLYGRISVLFDRINLGVNVPVALTVLILRRSQDLLHLLDYCYSCSSHTRGHSPSHLPFLDRRQGTLPFSDIRCSLDYRWFDLISIQLLDYRFSYGTASSLLLFSPGLHCAHNRCPANCPGPYYDPCISLWGFISWIFCAVQPTEWWGS
ncbi:hypothetical protein F5X68DRAFT_233904 [Plectosphaerella plurivora]|uniref:Uncharacterized protein n=1 Tax=Plectosphaerella plurivora TaxID=936078 RepID=A0A9P8V8B8_9PEZI|nr:hypothetical protein F5X68DRAFT_233904 [Plectosphaerella plurivora]